MFRMYLFEGIYVASPSMEPTLAVGRHVMVNKLAPSLRKPKRGEVVIFPSPDEPKKGLLKRVIAIEGDIVEIKKKKVYLKNLSRNLLANQNFILLPSL